MTTTRRVRQAGHTLAILAGLLGAAAVGHAAPLQPAAPVAPVAAPGAPGVPAAAPGAPADAAFASAARAAGAVFEATVVEIGRSPGAWSGTYAVYQSVTYRITRRLADRDRRLAVGDRVTVRHVLVAASDTADREPRLRPDLVRTGGSVIVLADWLDAQWTGIDERHGIVAADAAHRAAVARK